MKRQSGRCVDRDASAQNSNMILKNVNLTKHWHQTQEMKMLSTEH